MEWALRGPEGGAGERAVPRTERGHGARRPPRVGAELSPFLPRPYFREEPPGFEGKEDYPLSKEELLSYVTKSVRTENGLPGLAGGGAQPSWGLTPPPLPPHPGRWRRGSWCGSSTRRR